MCASHTSRQAAGARHQMFAYFQLTVRPALFGRVLVEPPAGSEEPPREIAHGPGVSPRSMPTAPSSPRCRSASALPTIPIGSGSSRSPPATSSSTTRRTSSTRRRCGSSSASPRTPRSRSTARRCSRARRSTAPRSARSCMSRCAPTPDEIYRAGGENVVPEVHDVLGRMADFANGIRVRRARRRRRPFHRRGQYRHRRLRPRPAHGDAGARALSTTGRASISSRMSTAPTSATR